MTQVLTAVRVNSTEHRSLDLALAAAETLITWMLAYPTALAFGKVLLQTAPERGAREARIEGFLRVMREVSQLLNQKSHGQDGEEHRNPVWF